MDLPAVFQCPAKKGSEYLAAASLLLACDIAAMNRKDLQALPGSCSRPMRDGSLQIKQIKLWQREQETFVAVISQKYPVEAAFGQSINVLQ